MSDYRTLNRTVTAKVEATAGTDAAPTVAADAVLVEDPAVAPGIEVLETNEVTGSLDPRAPIPGGGGANFGALVYLKGSGTGGVAPEYAPLLRGCGLAETLRAADETGTATAGTASTITLAAGTTGINAGDVITTTGGTGSGQTRVITAWDNGTKVATVYPDWTVTPDATTTYAVKASALYVPASQGLEHVTVYEYIHSSTSGVNSRLRKVLGWQGEPSFTIANRRLATVRFEGTGKFVSPSDVAHPGAATFDAQRPIPFMAADVALKGVTTRINQATFNLGNQTAAADDPADTFGIDVGQVTRRGIRGRLNPPFSLLSARDVIADFLASATSQLWLRWGTAGNAVSVFFPDIRYLGKEDEDLQGLMHEGVPFAAQGEDTGVYITIY